MVDKSSSEIVIDTPNRPNILKNDGYDLTFRLYHPGEHNGFTEYTEETFSFYFQTKALLSITDFHTMMIRCRKDQFQQFQQ